MAEDTKENNIYDFTAYRMQKTAEVLYASGDLDSAEALWEALEAYLEGLCDVQFVGGKTYLTPIDGDLAEDKGNKSV
jgi:hypothetical protein